MKLVVAGGRKFNDKARVFCLLNKIHAEHPDLEIVSGLAKGPDTFGKEWAEANGVKCHEFAAKWRVNGVYDGGAGYKRNREMAKFSDACLLFWDGISKGTGHMRDLGHEFNLPVAIVYYNSDTGEPSTATPKGISNPKRENEQDTLKRWSGVMS